MDIDSTAKKAPKTRKESSESFRSKAPQDLNSGEENSRRRSQDFSEAGCEALDSEDFVEVRNKSTASTNDATSFPLKVSGGVNKRRVVLDDDDDDNNDGIAYCHVAPPPATGIFLSTSENTPPPTNKGGHSKASGKKENHFRDLLRTYDIFDPDRVNVADAFIALVTTQFDPYS